MIKFLTATAALALAASAVHADPGGGKGGGKGNDKAQGGGHAAHAMQGGGGGSDKARGNDGGGKPDRVAARVSPGNSGKGNSGEARAERGNGKGNDRGVSNRDDDRGRDNVRVIRDDRVVVRDRDGDRDGRDRFDWDDDDGGRGLVNGCPPGLAKKNNGCMPPGLARDRYHDSSWDRPDWWGMDRVGDGRFAYYGGNLVRLNDAGGVLGYLPLLGGALAPGNVWPSFYQPVELPGYYQDYYGLGPNDNYRYYDDAIYGVDPQTQAITSIVALLTGDDFNVGQTMPLGYDVYNVPYSYRDQYVDGPDSMYRYSDGYVYQVDPKTRLVAAAIELLT